MASRMWNTPQPHVSLLRLAYSGRILGQRRSKMMVMTVLMIVLSVTL